MHAEKVCNLIDGEHFIEHVVVAIRGHDCSLFYLDVHGLAIHIITPHLCLLMGVVPDSGGQLLLISHAAKSVAFLWITITALSTRTAGLHICWLKLGIEENPVKPRHLITIHGFGYKFE